jgi:hypothetical protein
MWWYWNINQLSIAYASRPRLRSRLTLGGLTFPRKPWTYGVEVSRFDFATHAGIRTCGCSTPPHGETSQRPQRSPTDPRLRRGVDPAASVLRLAPLNYRRKFTRPVSYYALFQGWLLLSQPPGCLGNFTSFST